MHLQRMARGKMSASEAPSCGQSEPLRKRTWWSAERRRTAFVYSSPSTALNKWGLTFTVWFASRVYGANGLLDPP